MNVSEIVRHSTWLPGKGYNGPKPAVSILLPTFRRGSSGLFLRAANSILHQSLKDLELIVIDDASTDGTFDQIRELMNCDPRVSCVRHRKNVGLPAISCFEGFEKARADIIGFAFDDNEFYPKALEQLLTELRRLGARAVYGQMDMYVKDWALDTSGHFLLGDLSISTRTLVSHNYVPNAGVLVRREVFARVGWYDPHVVITRLCDWDLWLRIRLHYEMVPVNVLVGIEHGAQLADSLGATYPMSLWAIHEWMNLPGRHSKLRLSDFRNYDVEEVPLGASTYLRSVIEEARQYFRGRFWSSCMDENSEPGTVLVVTDLIDDSVSRYFEGLPPSVGSCVRIVQSSGLGRWGWVEIVGASCVVFARHSISDAGNSWLDRCVQLGVPHYLVVDEDFSELNSWIRSRQHNIQAPRNVLSSFSGILVGSANLLEHLQEQGIHNQLLYYPPVQLSGESPRIADGNRAGHDGRGLIDRTRQLNSERYPGEVNEAVLRHILRLHGSVGPMLRENRLVTAVRILQEPTVEGSDGALMRQAIKIILRRRLRRVMNRSRFMARVYSRIKGYTLVMRLRQALLS